MNSGTATRPVVVGVDGTSGSAGALAYAVGQAAARACRLVIVHAWPNPAVATPDGAGLAELEALGLEILEKARAQARALAPTVQIETVLTTGSHGSGVLRTAEHAQLVVVGRESRRGLERLVPGSTALQVAGHAPCVVTTVPADWAPSESPGQVVVGIAGRDHSQELLAHAFEAASTRQARLTIVTSWTLPDPYLDRIELRTRAAEWTANGVELLRDVSAEFRREYPDVPVDYLVEHGAAAEVLLGASMDADLVVIGRRRHALPPRWWLGRTAQAMVRFSPCPVELVPASSPYSSDGPSDLTVESAGAMLR